MNLLALLPLASKVLDKVIPDPEARAAAKAELLSMNIEAELEEMGVRRDIITAEAKSEHWLTSTWRPALMYLFGFIVANNYVIAPYAELMFSVDMALEMPKQLWQLLTLGVGGYVGGRSLEKAAKAFRGQ